MATPAAIAAMAADAMKGVRQSLAEIAAALDTSPPDIPGHNRDQDYLHADQLRVISQFLVEMVPVVQNLAKINAEMEHDLTITNGLWAFDSESGELVDPELKFQIWHNSLGSPLEIAHNENLDSESGTEGESEISDMSATEMQDLLSSLTLTPEDANLMTKPQLQEQLDKLGVDWKASDNKPELVKSYLDAIEGMAQDADNPDADGD